MPPRTVQPSSLGRALPDESVQTADGASVAVPDGSAAVPEEAAYENGRVHCKACYIVLNKVVPKHKSRRCINTSAANIIEEEKR